MRTINTVTILGNVVRDPELKVTAAGKEFATFSVATHKDIIKEKGRKTLSEFHNIVAWGSLSSIAKRFCLKGNLVYIEGSLKTRSWDHHSGVKMFKTEIIASNIIALPSSQNEKKEEEHIPPSSFSSNDFFGATEEDFFTDT